MADQKVTYLGKVDYRNKSLTFGIKERDRTRHMYVIGKTGMGKSTFLENMAIQDINNGEGVCVIDPHGSMAEKLLDYIPEHRIRDVVYFAPFDAEYPLGLNMLEKVSYEKRHLVANGLMAAFKKIWVDAWSARMEYILNNIILALLENEGQTLLGVNRMLTDKAYRKKMVSNVTDPTVKSFWTEEYANYTDKFAQEAAPAIQNKVGQFFGNPLIRNILGQTKTSFDPRKLMDEKKILIVNLSKGKVGEGNANLIGSLLITKIYLAAMSRADVGAYELEKLPPFYFYVDEFQNFANESFSDILSEARKYNLALTVAHQYVEQMEDEVKAAVFGNVGSMVVFRVGATDAEIFEKEFAPYFTMDDIVNLSAYQVYMRLMIDGVGSKPFSAATLPTPPFPSVSFAKDVIEYTRFNYGKKMAVAEDEIKRWYAPVVEEKKEVATEDKKQVEVKAVHQEDKRAGRDDRSSGRGDERRRNEEFRRDVQSNNHAKERNIQPLSRERVLPSSQSAEQQTPATTVSNQGQVQEDKRPAVQNSQTLKDALLKAMKEKEEEDKKKENAETKGGLDTGRERTDKQLAPQEKDRSPKEISEDVLRIYTDD